MYAFVTYSFINDNWWVILSNVKEEKEERFNYNGYKFDTIKTVIGDIVEESLVKDALPTKELRGENVHYTSESFKWTLHKTLEELTAKHFVELL